MQIKEYLDTEKCYVLVKDTCKRSEDWIEVPDGAQLLTIDNGGYKTFWNGDNSINVGYETEWREPDDGVFDFSRYAEYGYKTLWQRLQPESLPFIDDEAQSINDQYAEIEQVRQDMINHPSHYTSDPSGIECIEITRHRNFNIGNAMKYLWRNGLKDSDAQIQDLKKAIWYIEDEIKRLEK